MRLRAVDRRAAGNKELAPIRYGRIAASPFAFYSGAAAIMAADLKDTPSSGLRVQLCGDAHLGNFGGFAVSGDEILFDICDFDETLPGPWEWDIKRLATSVRMGGRLRIASHPPLVVPVEDLLPETMRQEYEECTRLFIDRIRQKMPRHVQSLMQRFKYLHMARRMVGLGSVGPSGWIILLIGRDEQGLLFLQAREAQATVLEPYLGNSTYASCGERVVEGQRLMQAVSDVKVG